MISSRRRQCGICRETGHNRRGCPRNELNILNRQSALDAINRAMQIKLCVLCHSESHDYRTCPFRKPAKRIHWDKCGKCGLDNTGPICICGEKQVVPVQPNEEGFHECTICLTNLRELNKVTTKCGHHFCVDCFLFHYTSENPGSGICPMCRAKLLEEQL